MTKWKKERLLWDIIVESGQKGLTLQSSSGAMPFGNNGPWNQEETPVRTTAHWAILFYRCFQKTEEKAFLLSSHKACQYLLSQEARPYDKTFFCRKGKAKDRANNVVGQAWALEALIEVGTAEGEQQYLNCAHEVIRLLPFNTVRNLWQRLEVDGSTTAACWTLNQQIMLAAVALKLANTLADAALAGYCRRFFDSFLTQTCFLEPGLPCHHLFPYFKRWYTGETTSAIWLPLKWLHRLRSSAWRKQSLGYVSFILYGLALARSWNPDEPFWDDPFLRKWVISLLVKTCHDYPFGFLEGESSFRWAYNPTGFEVAFALQTFEDFLDPTEHSIPPSAKHLWAELQFSGYYSEQDHLMKRNTCDPVGLAARIYEGSRLPNWAIRCFRIEEMPKSLQQHSRRP